MAEEKIFLQTFWDLYPDADAIPPFKALRNKRGDEASSRLMFYIRFLHDPEHEYIQMLPRVGREELLKEYCSIKKTDLSSALFKAAEEWYQFNYMSKPKQALAVIGNKVEDAGKAIERGAIYAHTDIVEHVAAIKAFKELAMEYESAKAVVTQEIKSTRIAKQFGKNEIVRPVDTGEIYD